MSWSSQIRWLAEIRLGWETSAVSYYLSLERQALFFSMCTPIICISKYIHPSSLGHSKLSNTPDLADIYFAVFDRSAKPVRIGSNSWYQGELLDGMAFFLPCLIR
jgi:hypothetical protein